MTTLTETDMNDLAMLACLNANIPHSAVLIAADVKADPHFVATRLSRLRDGGWPVHGSKNKGYVLAFDKFSKIHTKLRQRLEAYGREFILSGREESCSTG